MGNKLTSTDRSKDFAIEETISTCEDPEDCISPPSLLVMNNTLIHDKILGYLDYKDLLASRLLNHFWKSRVDRTLIPRTLISVDLRPSVQKDKKKRLELQGKLSTIVKYCIPNWGLHVYCDRQYSLAGPKKSKDVSVRSLLVCYGHIARHLKLSITMEFTDGHELNELFSYMRNMETLDLQIKLRNASLLNLGNHLKFPSLKNLIFSTPWKLPIHSPSLQGDWERRHFENVLLPIMRIFPNVESIGNVHIPTLYKCIHTHSPWDNLRKISANLPFLEDGEVFKMIRDLVPRGLVELQLQDISNAIIVSDPIAFDRFSDMLRKHAGTLVHLSLRFWDGLQWKSKPLRPRIMLPVFPKLRRLEFEGPGISSEDLNGEPSLQLRMDVVFPSAGGVVDYGECFPEIRELRLSHTYFDKDYGRPRKSFTTKEVANIFVPTEEGIQGSATMRWVEFDFPSEDRNWEKMFLKRLATIFPHVNHPGLIKNKLKT